MYDDNKLPLSDEQKESIKSLFTIDNQNRALQEIIKSFNDVYKYYFTIIKKILKKSNTEAIEEIKKIIVEIGKNEQFILNRYRFLLLYMDISKKFDSTKLIFTFEGQNKKNEFINLINQRAKLINSYKNNMMELEKLRNTAYTTYEEIYAKLSK